MVVVRIERADVQLIRMSNPYAKDWTFGKKFSEMGSGGPLWYIEVHCRVCNSDWTAQINRLRKGRACPSCSQTKSYKVHIQDILELNPHAKNWTFGDKVRYEGEKNFRIEVACTLCGYIWVPYISVLKKGCACPSCSGHASAGGKSIDYHISLILKNNPSAKNWTFGKKFKSQTSQHYRIEVTCNLCGYKWTPALTNLKRKTGCPSCSMTGPEMEIKYWLERQGLCINTDFIPQCLFEDLPSHTFDFYLPDFAIVIEYDGITHTEPVYGEESLANRQEKDEIKDHWCVSSGIEMIRIDYTQDLYHELERQVLPLISR